MRINIRMLTVLFALSIIHTSNSFSQSLPYSIIKKIDTLFAKWNTQNTPGDTIGIVKDDKLIYSKDMEWLTLNTK